MRRPPHIHQSNSAEIEPETSSSEYSRRSENLKNYFPQTRTGSQFVQCLCSYAVLYGFLAVYVGSMWALFYFHFTWQDFPRLTGQHNLLRMEPRLSMIPTPDYMTRLIRFKKGHRYTYRKYEDDMVAYTQWYELPNAAQDTVMERCDKTERELTDFGSRSACQFDLTDMGPCNIVNDFGYDDGMPCIALKINRIYGWIPKKYHDDGIHVSCQGETPLDDEYMGPVCYYGDMDKSKQTYPDSDCEHPEYGVFKYYYFPFMKQANYHSPLVFMEFRNPIRSIVMRIRCSLQGDYDNSSSIGFEILID